MLLTWATSQGANAPGFSVALQSSLTPSQALGSPTPTFTRASAAAHTDFEGIVRQVPAGAFRPQGARVVMNLYRGSSEDFSNASWAQGSPSATGGAGVITFVGSGNDFRLQNGGLLLFALAAGHTYVMRAVIQAGTKTGTIKMGQQSNSTYLTITPTSTPKIYTFSFVGVAGGFTGFVNGDANAGTVLVSNAQIEDVTGQTNQNPSEYVPSLATANADSGAIGVAYPWIGYPANVANKVACLNGNTVVGNVVVEAQGPAISSSRAECAGGVTAGVVDANGPLGYLAEGARTNLILQSQNYAVTWALNVLSITGTTTAPDGTDTGTQLTSIGSGNNFVGQTVNGITNNATLTWSFHVKAGSATVVGLGDGSTVNDLASYNLSTVTATKTNATTATIATLPNGWFRCTATFTITGTAAGFKVYQGSTYPGTNGTGTFYLWGAQLEAASFASSYIPTTTLAVTKVADVDQGVSATNLPSTHSGTMQITPVQAMGSATVFHFGTYVDANNYTAVLSDGTNLTARKRIGGSNHDATIAWARAAGTVAKVGWRFDTTNGADIWLNGTKGSTDATLTAAQIGTNFQIGADGNSLQQDFCEHRLLNPYPASISSARMGALTA